MTLVFIRRLARQCQWHTNLARIRLESRRLSLLIVRQFWQTLWSWWKLKIWNCYSDVPPPTTTSRPTTGSSAGSTGIKLCCVSYGWNFSGRTEYGKYVRFFVFSATVFGNLEVWKVNKCYIFLKVISAGVQWYLHINQINLLYSII